MPFVEGQTVDRADFDSTGPRLLTELRAHRVRYLVLAEPPGARSPEAALGRLGLSASGVRLLRRYASPALGPERRPVAVGLFEIATGGLGAEAAER